MGKRRGWERLACIWVTLAIASCRMKYFLALLMASPGGGKPSFSLGFFGFTVGALRASAKQRADWFVFSWAAAAPEHFSPRNKIYRLLAFFSQILGRRAGPQNQKTSQRWEVY